MGPIPHSRVRPIPSPYGIGRETGYTAQEDLKSIDSYNRRGKDDKDLFFCVFLHSKALLGLFIYLFIYLFSVLSSLGHHTGEGNERVGLTGGEFAVWVGMGKELGLQGHPKP